jgi:membrane associated rhomboid family serine protease
MDESVWKWLFLDIPRIREMASTGLVDWPRLAPLFTSSFFDTEWKAVVGNCFALFMFGWRLWRAVGGVGVWTIYLLGGAFGNVALVLTEQSMRVPAGAGGAVLAVATASTLLLGKDRFSAGPLG